jgi:hypothetical protein
LDKALPKRAGPPTPTRPLALVLESFCPSAHSVDVEKTYAGYQQHPFAAARRLVVCNVLADHWAEMLGVEVQQVNSSWRILERIIATPPHYLSGSVASDPTFSISFRCST